MGFKTFVAIYLSIVIVVSAFVIVAAPRLQTRNETAANHFSVVWGGYRPPYNNGTPDYYVCINNLLASVLQMNIALKVQNFENSSYYFCVDKYEDPPTGWNVTPYQYGSIGIDQTVEFVYSNLAREKPASIPSGKMTETINLAVKAYYDAGYTSLYSQDNFTVQYHFIDIDSTSWVRKTCDNFDDGTWQGWGAPGYYPYLENYGNYRSWPTSAHTGAYSGGYCFEKAFDTAGPYTEAYLVFALYRDGSNDVLIDINGVTMYRPDKISSGMRWYQHVIRLPISSSVSVRITGIDGNLDDAYLIAK
jgi:hypothetical protein